MRDPAGRLAITESSVVRHLTSPTGSAHFLKSALAAHLVDEGKLIAFALIDSSTVTSPRLPFVSQPTEWCDSQLFDAAALTLDIQRQATAAGFDLKDASAWNVLFSGTRPIFCDLLSFEHLNRERWWAAGQFARHFISPLWLAQQRGLHGMDCFKCWRDGVDPDRARAMLGFKRYLHRCWPLVAAGGKGVAPQALQAQEPSSDRSHAFRRRLYASLQWMLDGVRPQIGPARGVSPWSGYTDERHHYPAGSLSAKQRQVHAWLAQLAPTSVIDLGCNTGEFTAMALDTGAEVIAIDADHDCIDRLYRAYPDQKRLHPVLASIDDMGGGRGWAGAEHPGLPTRLAGMCDVVLMLAVLHHLAVGASIPLVQIAQLAKTCTRRWVIIEWIHQDDVQLERLAHQRCREPAEFSLQAQRQAFLDAGFLIESEVSLAPASRTLALLKVDR